MEVKELAKLYNPKEVEKRSGRPSGSSVSSSRLRPAKPLRISPASPWSYRRQILRERSISDTP